MGCDGERVCCYTILGVYCDCLPLKSLYMVVNGDTISS